MHTKNKKILKTSAIILATAIVLFLVYLRLDHVYSPHPLYKAIRNDPFSSVTIPGVDSERIMLDDTGGSEDAVDFFYQLNLFGSSPQVSYERWLRVSGDESRKLKIRDDAAALAEKYGWKRDQETGEQTDIHSFLEYEKVSPQGELMELGIHLDSENGTSDDQTSVSQINTLRLNFRGTEGVRYQK